MVKQVLLCLAVLASSIFVAFSQGVGINTTTPDPSAGLDISFNDRGLLPPRLNSTERDGISNPAIGLMIFNTTTGCFNYWLGSSWYEVCGDCTPQPSPAANAGADQLNISGTSATLSANTPTSGSGNWSIVSGSGGSFGNSSSPASSFSGSAGNSYVLRWIISTACDSTSDEVSVSFVSPFTCGSSTISDASGNTYNTVQVGSQCWMKSNLKTAKYSDGSDIPSSYMDQWGLNGAPSCSASNFNAASCGVLYDGNVFTNSVSPCPTGWHIPKRSEYETLYTAVSNDSRRLFASGICSSNCSGFDLYICGQHYTVWEGCGSGDQIYLWTKPTASETTYGYITQYNSGSGGVSYNTVQASWLSYNYSIRCIQD